MFVLSPARAHPPTPPICALDISDLERYSQILRKTESERGVKQIMHATGVLDLRCILLIRRAFHPISQSTHNESSQSQDDETWLATWSQGENRTEGDEEDIGGEEGLNRSEDRPRLRMQRSFELLLTTGRIVRFEVMYLYSPGIDFFSMASGSFIPSGHRMD